MRLFRMSASNKQISKQSSSDIIKRLSFDICILLFTIVIDYFHCFFSNSLSMFLFLLFSLFFDIIYFRVMTLIFQVEYEYM